MRTFRIASTVLLAGVMIICGAVGLSVTHTAWSACGAGQLTDACLRVMDAPPHVATLQLLWAISVVCALVAVAHAFPGAHRAFAVGAAIVVRAMNNVAEYALWVSFSGGHWDVPPGTGYTQAGAFIIAGLLILAGFSRRRSAERAATAWAVRTAG